ncbi:F-box protein FBW2-like [Magnolia sinica]|uniref:F-box protein FBW2-like n=1 Tax=Magnolia sinica TaxID=86752 RepID=UPI0026585ED1|nr:F-box protein FBW2-like [Magnolia sinica]
MEPHLIHWSDLIQEALIYIFSMLDFDSLIAVTHVCRSWRDAAIYPECWDSVHLTLHQNFLDRFIRDAGPLDLKTLNSMSIHVLERSGTRARSICIDSIASDQMIDTIAARSPSIESLSLRNCNSISSSKFSKLILTCKNLKFIDISSCNITTAKTIEEIGENCLSIVGLNLAHLQVTEEMLIAMGKFMPKLKWLNLNNTPITNNSLCSILHSCNELQYLSAMWCPRLDPNKEIMDMAMNIAEFKCDQTLDDRFECDVSYLDKWLLHWFP